MTTSQPSAPDSPVVVDVRYGTGGSLPAIFKRAEWRCTLNVSRDNRMGLGFTLEDGSVVRLSVDVACAHKLHESLGFHFDQVNALAGTQAPISELSPSEPKSVSSDGVSV